MTTNDNGVTVERRGFLGLAAAGILGGPRALYAAVEAGDDGSMSLEQFLEEVAPMAKRLVADDSALGQDAYLHAIASYAVKVAETAQPEFRPTSQGKGVGIGVHPGGDPFTVLHWRMEPGSRIRRHAHTYGNVVTLGLVGEAVVENWEVIGRRDYETKSNFRARCTVRQVLRQHDINLVSLERNYIHGFVAGPQGAEGLDLTTRLRNKQTTPFLETDAEPVDAASGVYEARWVRD